MSQGEVNIIYCPTEQMWSDVLTKSLQWQQFRLMRALIMSCLVNYDKTYNQYTISNKNLMIQPNKSVISPHECVGFNAKMPPTCLWCKARQRIPQNNEAKIWVTLSQKDEDTKGLMKEVRWSDMKKDQDNKPWNKMTDNISIL